MSITSIIIPAYNEESRILPTLIEAHSFFFELTKDTDNDFEILCVNDGSTDNTISVIEKFIDKTDNRTKLINCIENRGKGNAVRLGMRKSKGDFCLFTDADGSTPIQEYTKLKSYINGKFDIVIGSRAIKSSKSTVKTSLHRKVLGRIFNNIINFIVLPGIKDTQCGFKLFTKESAQILFSQQKYEGFSFDVEILYIARKNGYEIAEVPINWTNVPNSKVNLLSDSFKMLLDSIMIHYHHGSMKVLKVPGNS